MSRWHFSTTEAGHDRARRVSDDAGLRLASEQVSEGSYAASYEKRAFSSSNFARLGSDSWICGAGTLACGGGFGAEAFEAFGRICLQDGVAVARSAATGHYSVCLRMADRIVAFTDEQAVIPLFYGSNDAASHVLGNSLHVVAVALGRSTAEDRALVASVFSGDAVGADVFIDGIKRLFGTEIIEIDVATGELLVRPVDVPAESLSPEETADIDVAVAAYVARVREVLGSFASETSIALNNTGGLDTRTVLAALLASGVTPMLIYGVGNSDLSMTRTHDLETARLVAAHLDLDLYEMDWSGTQPFSDEHIAGLQRRYGLLYSYGLSEGLLRELEGGITPYPRLQLSGYGPEQSYRKGIEDGSVEDILRSMTAHERSRMTAQASAEHLDWLRVAARQAMSAAGAGTDAVELGELLGDRFMRVFRLLDAPFHAENIRFFNEFGYYMAPLFLNRLAGPMDTLPPEYLVDGRFQVMVIRALAPQVLDVPVASGDGARMLTPDGLALEPWEETRVRSIGVRVFRRLAPNSVRQAIVGTLGLDRMPWLPGLSPDTAKDARVSERVRHATIADMRRRFPEVAARFDSLNLHLVRLGALEWRLRFREKLQSDGRAEASAADAGAE